MHCGLPGWRMDVLSFTFSLRERNLFPFRRLTLALLETAWSARVQDCRVPSLAQQHSPHSWWWLGTKQHDWRTPTDC